MTREKTSSRTRLLVIRFGALGDLCLLAWSLARLAASDRPETFEVTLVTKESFADLMRCVPGVTTVMPLPGGQIPDLLRLGRRLKSTPFEKVIDAHHNLRSHLLLAILGRKSQTRLAKDTVARLTLLCRRKSSPVLERTMRDRFDELLAGLVVTDRDPPPPLAHLAPNPPRTVPLLGLAPGAHWETKRWPEGHFTRFLTRFRDLCEHPVRLFLGPRERDWFEGSELATAAARMPGVEVWRDRSVVEVAAGLAECTTVVTNDSGLLHLAEAVGTPVLGLFGPTVRQFGYFPSLEASRVLERELPCRPCSRNGRRPCHRGDLACLAEISTATVLDTLRAMPTWAAHLSREDLRG